MEIEIERLIKDNAEKAEKERLARIEKERLLVLVEAEGLGIEKESMETKRVEVEKETEIDRLIRDNAERAEKERLARLV